MVLYLLRGAFFLLTASVTMLYVLPYQREMFLAGEDIDFFEVVLMLGLALGVTSAIIAADIYAKHKRLSALSGIFLGLIAGLVVAFALGFVVDLIALIVRPDDLEFAKLMQGVKVIIGLITCYLSMSLVMQTKDDFRFIIPYVEFAKQIRGNRPAIVDTSVIIDGRILDIVETQFLQGTLVVPKFILTELQAVADSADKLKRARGRRGLEVLQKLQNSNVVDVVIEDSDAEGVSVDQKLVSLGQRMQARVMTTDYNLNKIAQLRGVDVVNVNDLAKALRPVALPGEAMELKVIKPGEGPDQGVGYLDDGTMVVVEDGRSMIGKDIVIVVTSMLQTSAGRMIFGRFHATQKAPEPGGAPRPDAPPSKDESDRTPPPSPPPAERTSRGGRNPRRAS